MSAKTVAIIMDGNGRWAKQRGFKRTHGHKIGAEVAREITTHCAKRGDIKNLILYAFSTENWKRPKSEVDFLMKLLYKYLKEEEQTYVCNNIRFRAIGDLSAFSKKVQKQIKHLETLTQHFTNFTQYLALNYGARDELKRAFEKIEGSIDEQSITKHLDFSGEVDILIRTGGEKRLSNFLLWQSAYAELFFSDTPWPEFGIKEFEKIMESFEKRERRFGGL